MEGLKSVRNDLIYIIMFDLEMLNRGINLNLRKRCYSITASDDKHVNTSLKDRINQH